MVIFEIKNDKILDKKGNIVQYIHIPPLGMNKQICFPILVEIGLLFLLDYLAWEINPMKAGKPVSFYKDEINFLILW